MTTYPISNYEDAVDFANRLVKFARSKKFKSFSIDTDWGKIRSTAQSRWYFRSIGRLIVPHLINHPELLRKLIERAIGIDKEPNINTRLIHELLKLVYFKGSTTKITTEVMAAKMKELRHDFLHDVPSLYIPEPPILSNPHTEPTANNNGDMK